MQCRLVVSFSYLFLIVTITGCAKRNVEFSWKDQWNSIVSVAEKHNSHALPYSVDAHIGLDDPGALFIDVSFFTPEGFFAVEYVNSERKEVLKIAGSPYSVADIQKEEANEKADLIRSVVLGPHEVSQIIESLPEVKRFVAAYGDLNPAIILFADKRLITDLGTSAAWTRVYEERVDGEIKTVRVWVDGFTGKVRCIVTDGSMSNGCMIDSSAGEGLFSDHHQDP